jgi:hypothetical protein
VPTGFGLSIGAKAGIGIGIGLVAFLGIVGLVIFFLRRRKSQQKSHYLVHELRGSSMPEGAPRWGGELKPPTKQQELYVHEQPAELESPGLNEP